MRSFILFIKNEIVLTAAAILAIASAFVIHPDGKYLEYVDFRTLGLLFCLMVVVGGFQRLGLFRKIAQGLLRKVGRSSVRVVLVLVLLAFFFSMLITNDVGLITFVPFTFTVLELLGEKERNRLVIPVVVLETLGANLGSMMTPIGNPQNLYLFGQSGLGVGEFLLLTLPYTMMAGVLLVVWAIVIGKGGTKGRGDKDEIVGTVNHGDQNKNEGMISRGGKNEIEEMLSSGGKDETVGKQGHNGKNEIAKAQGKINEASSEEVQEYHATLQENLEGSATGKKKTLLLVLYGILFLLSLLTVAKVLEYPITLGVTLVVVLLFDRKTLWKVDYFLLLTFIAFFVFIGNMGRIPAFADFLAQAVKNREVPVAILASQAISNVPAALLLSGFTDNYKALIIGTNLGGMGTLIASMASLISYKYVARLIPDQKGRYFRYFTVANVIFLGIIFLGYLGLKALGFGA